MRFGILLGVLLVSVLAWSAEFETALAITNVTLIPAPTQSISGATIVIQDGRIKAAGASIVAPPDARVVDGQGLYAYAGFIDGASHVGVPDAKPSKEELDRLLDVELDVRQGPPTGMQLANRNGVWPHRTIRDVYTPDTEVLERWRKAGFTVALVTSRPAILGGTGDIVQLSGAPLRHAVLASDVTQIVSFRSMFGEGFTPSASYPGSVMGVVAMIRQAFVDAEWYRQQHALYERYPNQVERPLHDPVLEAMGALVDRNQTILFNANTKAEIHHALDLAQEFNQRPIILGGKEAWKAKERLAAERVPVILSPHWKDKPRLAPNAKKENSETRYTTASWTPEWEDDFFEPLGVRKERVRLWEEEVDAIRSLIAAGVDVGITGREAKNAEELWKKLRDALELGLSKDDLLAALTTNPARILGIEGQLGTVEGGKLADLALFTQPIEDKKTKLRYSIIDGELFEYSVTAKPEKKEGEASGDEGEKAETDDDDIEEGDSEKEESAEKPPVDKHPFAFETEADRAPGLHTGGTVLLKNATVVTVTGGTLSSNDIAVVDGKIHQIGPNLGAPEGATVIDLTGYWVMPGIIDPHSHIGSGGGINEYTQSITCEVRMADVVDDGQEELHRALAGGVTTIHLMHGSANAIGGQNAVLKLKRNSTPREVLVTSGPRLVKFALGENPTRANSPQRGRRFPGTRMGVEAVIRHGFNDALEYRKAWQEYAEETAQGEITLPPRRDLRLEALSDILRGEIWVHSHCYRADEMIRLMTVAQDYGFQIACLQHVLEGYRAAPEIYAHGAAASTFSDWWGYKKEAYDAVPYNAAMLSRAGIVTSVNSDSEDVIRYLNLEAAKTLRFGGLNADEAIRLCTINPAIQLGLDSRIGRIEVGKDADFAVLNRHPLDTYSHCVMTMIEGEPYFIHRDFNPTTPQPGPGSQWIPSPPQAVLEVPPSPENFYAIVGATIHPISSGPIPNGVLVVRDGAITAVSQNFTPPEGATVIRADGLHVYPGLINAYTLVGLAEIESILGTVDTTEIATFQPDIRAMSALNPHSEHVRVTRCEGITTVGIFPDGGTICGQGALAQLAGWTMPEMLRRADISLAINLPALPANILADDRDKQIKKHGEEVKAIEDFFNESRLYAELRKAGLTTTNDLRLEAMRPYIEHERKVFMEANSYKEILEAVKFAETFSLDPVIVGGGEAWKCASMLKEKSIPVIVTSVYTLALGPFDLFDGFYSAPAKLEAAGVDFCIATGGSAYAKRLPVHAGMAVAHGLDPDRAVRAITLDAARILGVDDEIGSLEVNKTADVIITTGDPCQASTRTVVMLLAGKPMDLSSLHEESFEKFSNRPDPGLEPVKPGALRGPSAMHTR